MRVMGRDLEKKMGGYGVGKMPLRNTEESPVKRENKEEGGDLDEVNQS